MQNLIDISNMSNEELDALLGVEEEFSAALLVDKLRAAGLEAEVIWSHPHVGLEAIDCYNVQICVNLEQRYAIVTNTGSIPTDNLKAAIEAVIS